MTALTGWAPFEPTEASDEGPAARRCRQLSGRRAQRAALPGFRLIDPQFGALVDADLATGQHRNPKRRPHWFTTAYFHRADELATEITDAGRQSVEIGGVQGLAGWISHLENRRPDEPSRRTIIDSAALVETEPALLGVGAHLLAIAHTSLIS